MNAILEQYTTAQLTAAIRSVLQFAFGSLVTNGLITNDESQIIAGSVAGLIVLAYGVYKRRKDGLIHTTTNVKGVEEIVTDEKTANKIPSPKVVSRKKQPPIAANQAPSL